MPDPAGTLNDGGIKFVRQTISAKDESGTSTTFVVKKGSLKGPVNRITSHNENNVENKQAFMLGIRTGSMTLQFVNAGDKVPARLQVIAGVLTTGIAVNIIIGEVDEEFGAGEEAMVTCQIYEQQVPTGGGGPEPG